MKAKFNVTLPLYHYYHKFHHCYFLVFFLQPLLLWRLITCKTLSQECCLVYKEKSKHSQIVWQQVWGQWKHQSLWDDTPARLCWQLNHNHFGLFEYYMHYCSPLPSDDITITITCHFDDPSYFSWFMLQWSFLVSNKYLIIPTCSANKVWQVAAWFFSSNSSQRPFQLAVLPKSVVLEFLAAGSLWKM